MGGDAAAMGRGGGVHARLDRPVATPDQRQLDAAVEHCRDAFQHHVGHLLIGHPADEGDQRRLDHLSLRKLSELAGISNPYLSQIERGLRKPSAEILQQIARALEISAETLYVRAGILEERDGADLVAEIRRDPQLTEEQKKTLIRIYTSFRHENEDGGPADEEEAGTPER